MKAKAIERIAEELGVSFYDLHPLISARDEFHIKEGRREVVEWLRDNGYEVAISDEVGWQEQLEEWGIEKE